MNAKSIQAQINKLDDLLNKIAIVNKSLDSSEDKYGDLIALLDDKYDVSEKDKSKILMIVHSGNRQKLENDLMASCYLSDIVPTKNDKLMPLKELRQKILLEKSDWEKLLAETNDPSISTFNSKELSQNVV